MDERQLAEAHRRLLDEIDAEVSDTAAWTGCSRLSERVRAAMARVPRHLFVADRDLAAAYENRPLAIGHGQTISQPYIVAIMTELLDLGPTDRVLEVGTGCGYQSAVLAEVAGEVFSIEVVPDLADAAAERLHRLGYDAVHVRAGDGFLGWPEAAPFDAIMVTAAPLAIPPVLVEELTAGGRLVVPVGEPGETQMLYRCVRDRDGVLHQDGKLPVAFVPMIKKA
jgi:protein-L-isoaspartate(D-aspartate) O-methyltransferase